MSPSDDSISSRSQDANWKGSKLIVLGAVSLAIFLAIIFILASTISKSDLRTQAPAPIASHSIA